MAVGVIGGLEGDERDGPVARFGSATDVTEVLLHSGDPDAVRAVAEGEERPVLALCADPNRRNVSALLAAGAAGVAAADATDEEVEAAAAAVAAGYTVVPRAVEHAVRRPMLTARQKQILSLVVLGLRNREIADRLFLSEATVKTHLTAIFAQLGVSSRREAVDLILDPAAGLGTGILGIAQQRGVQIGYGAPRVSD